MIRNLIRRAFYRFRSAITGRWITKAEAERDPEHTVKERVK